MKNPRSHPESCLEWDEELLILNYASRLFMAVSDKKILLGTALETFADFGHADRAGILLLNRETGTLETGGLYDSGIIAFPDTLALRPFLTPTSPAYDVLSSCHITTFPAARSIFPLPSRTEESDTFCICIPVAHTSHNVTALITLLMQSASLEINTLQRLRMLASLFAVSLENMRLFEMAIYDSLTGVHVRGYFEIKAHEEMTKMQRSPQTLGIILMDMDKFKNINDRFGHVAGDNVLVEFARCISQGLRKEIDIVCRYGGDEFVILLPQTEAAQTESVARRILNTVRTHTFKSVPADYTISVSAGAMTIGPADHLTIQELVHKVDTLLYKGKQLGGNSVICLGEQGTQGI